MKSAQLFSSAKALLVKLIQNKCSGDPELILNHYTYKLKSYTTLNDVYHRLISSMSNRNMMASVVKRGKKEQEVGELLGGFDPQYVVRTYANHEQLYEGLKNHFIVGNESSPRNLWKIFAHGVYSGAVFLSRFKDIQEFDTYVADFSNNAETKAALPMVLQRRIFGFGFTLACDFLKELGYTDYPKPDVHLRDILNQTGLSYSKNDYDLYVDIVTLAQEVGVTPYEFDRVLWLVGSGKLDDHNIQLGNNKKRFIAMCKAGE